MTEEEAKVDDQQKEIGIFLMSAFSKIQDINGQRLDITLALPTLITIISSTSQISDKKKYDFLGPAACQLAVRGILIKEYSGLLDYLQLESVVEEFGSFQRMNTLIWKEMNFEVIKPTLSHDIIQTIAGVLVTFVGLSAVIMFIGNAVVQITTELIKSKIRPSSCIVS